MIHEQNFPSDLPKGRASDPLLDPPVSTMAFRLSGFFLLYGDRAFFA